MNINDLIKALQERAAEIGGDSPVIAWILSDKTPAEPLTKLAVSRFSAGYDTASGQPIAVLQLIEPAPKTHLVFKS
jgi:hypothetical protein